jgi:hypothetical protein
MTRLDPPQVRRIATLTPLLVIASLALILMWRPIAMGHIFMPIDALLHVHPWRYSYERVPVNNPRNTDPIRQTYPRRLLTNQIVEQGALPLWNRSIISGTPLLDDGQLTFFYPLSLIFYAVPLSYSFGLFAFLHLIIAGLGTYAFAGRIGLSRGAATLAGVSFMFSGYLLTWLQYPHHMAATAVLPWCFWAVARACDRRDWPGWLLAGLLLAIPPLTHAQLTFYIYLAVGLYLLRRLAGLPGWHSRFRQAAGFSGAVLLALALAAVQLLPAFALSAGGQRADLGFAPASAEFQLSMLMRLVFPVIDGQPRVGPPPAWGPELLQVPYPYAGLATLLLTGLALLRSRHPQSSFFALLALLSFLLAANNALLEVFMILVPPYRQFEDHSRWFVLWGFAVALLAAMGADTLAGRRPAAESRPALLFNRSLLAALLAFGAIWGLYHLQLFTPASRYGDYITIIRQQPLLPPLIFGLGGLPAILLLALRRMPPALRWAPLIVLVAADLLWYGAGYNTSTDLAIAQPTSDHLLELANYPAEIRAAGQDFPPTRQTAFLQSQTGIFRIFGVAPDVLAPNLAGAYGLEDIRGYHSLFTERYARLARLADGKDFREGAAGSAVLRPYFSSSYNRRRILNMLNVRYLVADPQFEGIERWEPLELVHQSDEGRIYENLDALPRAWLVYDAESIATDDAQLERMAQPDFDPARLVILDAAAPPVGPATAAQPPVVVYQPNQVLIAARTDAPAILVLADNYYPGWRVTVNGEPTELYRANYTLRGVWLPPGDHSVIFSYQPPAWQIGGAISGLALIFVLGAGLVVWKRGRGVFWG